MSDSSQSLMRVDKAFMSRLPNVLGLTLPFLVGQPIDFLGVLKGLLKGGLENLMLVRLLFIVKV